MSSQTCISEQELRDFVLGELPDEAAERVTTHLEDCPACESAASRLDKVSDPLLESLRRVLGSRGQTTAAVPASLAVPPRTLGKNGAARPNLVAYEVLEELGRGGMGVVYRARDRRLGRVVALKIIKAGMDAGSELRDRFRREATALACLQHPGIVQIFDVGEQDGSPFLALEFVAGCSLAQRLGGAPLTGRAAATLLENLARAIAYAHQQGVLHRDLTPANVLVGADGVAKITDFGLARLLSESATLTRTGAVMGTPSYLAPEQADGQARTTGPAADIYALGAILYECLTGRPPFRAATVLETLAQVVRDEPVSPRRLLPQVPRDLETVCLKCLRKEPRQRYASALDLAADLRRFLDNQPIQARPVGMVESFWRWGRRNPGWAAALLAIVVAAVGAAIAAVHLSGALADLEKAYSATHDAQRETLRKLYRSTVNEARAKRLSRKPGQRIGSLALLKEALKLARQLALPDQDFRELRDDVIACLALPDLELVREWDGYPRSTWRVDFDEALTLYAHSDGQGQVTVRHIADDTLVASLPGEGHPKTPLFSPDSRFLVTNSQTRPMQLWKLGDPVPLLEMLRDDTAGLPLFPCSFRADSRQLAVLRQNGTITVHDLAHPVREIHRSKPALPTIKMLAFHPTRPLLALASGNQACLYDLETCQVTARLAHPNRVPCLSWSTDGRLLATFCDDVVIRLYAVGTETEPRLTHKFSGHFCAGGMVNRDGTLLASSDWSGNLRLWDARGENQLVLPLPEGGMYRLAPDRDLLACTAPKGKLHLYRIHRGAEFRQLSAHSACSRVGWRSWVLFDPSGRLLIGDAREGLNVWNTHTGAMLHRATGRWMIPLGFDAQGALLAESADGFQRWPKDVQPGLLRLGPPTLLDGAVNQQRLACSSDGHVLAVPAINDGAWVILADRPGAKIHLRHLGTDVRFCAVSPDGRWVATGLHGVAGPPAMVWHAQTGERAWAFPGNETALCDVGFSPDGRWLITADPCRLWQTESWRPGPTLGGKAFAFAPDSRMVAVDDAEGAIRLLEVATGKEYVRLTAPGEQRCYPSAISPDGTLLAVFGSETRALHLWDLRAVRAHLQEWGLDWNLPPYPPALPAAPLRLELLEK